MLNRITISINSRKYTVVANENEAYIRSLCEYVNDKVGTVLREGNHVMGEKPLLLAALNICDEYFKALEKSNFDVQIDKLLEQNRELKEQNETVHKLVAQREENIKTLTEELDITEKMLHEAETKIAELENNIQQRENAMRKQRSDFAIREKTILDMLDKRK